MTSRADLTWQILFGLQWGKSERAGDELPHIKKMRSTLVGDLILLKRMVTRESDLDRPLPRIWLAHHLDTRDFLLWLDSPAGRVARILAERKIGLLIDDYLEFLWGEE